MINLFGPINSLGYGVVFRNLCKALVELNELPMSVSPVGGRLECETPEELRLFQSFNKLFNIKHPSLMVWHAWEMHHFCGTPRIGMPIFEGTNFNTVEANCLTQLDYIAVMSEWAKEVVVSQEVKEEGKVFIIPGGVDECIFNPAVQPSTHKSKQYNFTFLSSGKFEIRKGHKLLLDSFIEAFHKKVDGKVRLMVHWFNPFVRGPKGQSFEEMLDNTLVSKGFTHTDTNQYAMNNIFIEYIPRVKTQRELASIYQSADAGVFPYFAEGWNLPLIEMMAIGKPCLATSYSAPMDFIAEETNYLITDFTMEKIDDPRWFNDDAGYWAVPKKDKLMEDMLYMYYRKREDKEMGKKASVHILENFTWKHSAAAIIEMTDTIGG